MSRIFRLPPFMFVRTPAPASVVTIVYIPYISCITRGSSFHFGCLNVQCSWKHRIDSRGVDSFVDSLLNLSCLHSRLLAFIEKVNTLIAPPAVSPQLARFQNPSRAVTESQTPRRRRLLFYTRRCLFVSIRCRARPPACFPQVQCPPQPRYDIVDRSIAQNPRLARTHPPLLQQSTG